MKKASKNITTFVELLDNKYGKKGAPKREKWEHEFKVFRLGVLPEEARLKMSLTQEELAEKCGTPPHSLGLRRTKKATEDKALLRQGYGGQRKLR